MIELFSSSFWIRLERPFAQVRFVSSDLAVLATATWRQSHNQNFGFELIRSFFVVEILRNDVLGRVGLSNHQMAGSGSSFECFNFGVT